MKMERGMNKELVELCTAFLNGEWSENQFQLQFLLNMDGYTVPSQTICSYSKTQCWTEPLPLQGD